MLWSAGPVWTMLMDLGMMSGNEAPQVKGHLG